ncbi:MAG TPA: transcriptional regulator [Flavobacterium sp.]|nr:transcriptional regulator [Flavobacterium sp.]
MGLTKHIAYKEDINQIAEIFKALGHPARIQIMSVLLSQKSCSCGTIVDILPLAQSTVSNHLLELKKANLVSLTFIGKSSVYSINKENFKTISQFINNFSIEHKKSNFKTIANSLHNPEIKVMNFDIKPIPTVAKSSTNLKQYNYQFKNKKNI